MRLAIKFKGILAHPSEMPKHADLPGIGEVRRGSMSGVPQNLSLYHRHFDLNKVDEAFYNAPIQFFQYYLLVNVPDINLNQVDSIVINSYQGTKCIWCDWMRRKI